MSYEVLPEELQYTNDNMKKIIILTFTLFTTLSFGQMITISKEYDEPGMVSIYDEQDNIIEKIIIDGTKKNRKEIRKKLGPHMSKLFNYKDFKNAKKNTKTTKISKRDSLPKMGILPPNYHIIDDFDTEIITELPPMDAYESVINSDSTTNRALKTKIQIKILKKDSLLIWPSESTGIYQIIEDQFGDQLIDWLESLTNQSNSSSNDESQFGIHQIEIDGANNDLIIEIIDDSFSDQIDSDRIQALEDQIELLNKKLDSMKKEHDENMMNELVIRVRESVRQLLETYNLDATSQ